MAYPTGFYVLAALWAVAMVSILIAAIRLCYAIERRSETRPGRLRLPSYANLLPVAFNVGVARDAKTQAVRRKMNGLLLALLAGLLAFAAGTRWLLPVAVE